jgi:DNA-binding HxlR family transcriptional regulator
MKRVENKPHCPVTFALETVGDAWSLLIVRDIVFWGKRTCKEFLASDEAISINVLAARLAHPEQRGILVRKPHASDRRREVYTLTEKGLGLIPVLLEMSGWSARNDPDTAAPRAFVDAAYADRATLFAAVQDAVRRGGSLFGEGGLLRRPA